MRPNPPRPQLALAACSAPGRLRLVWMWCLVRLHRRPRLTITCTPLGSEQPLHLAYLVSVVQRTSNPGQWACHGRLYAAFTAAGERLTGDLLWLQRGTEEIRRTPRTGEGFILPEPSNPFV